MVDVQRDLPEYEKAGGRLVAVTMGTPDEAARFRDDLHATFEFLADAEQAVYRAYGLPRGTAWQIAGPKVWLPAIRAIARGGVGRPVGDIRQMPGLFVIDTSGILRLAHYPTNQTDRAKHAEVLAAIE